MAAREEQIRILLAEDNEKEEQLFSDLLKKIHLSTSVVWVKDGEEVLDYLLNRKAFQDRTAWPKPDLIFLDINMPRKGGREAFNEMMSHAELRGVPVIFLTSVADQETAVTLMKAGATDYLNKFRLNAEVLERSIRYALEIHKKETLRQTAEQLAIRLGRVMDNSSNEIYMFSADTHFLIQTNRGMRRHIGYSPEELMNMRPIDFMPDLSEKRFADLIAPLLTGERTETTFETIHLRKNGTRYPVEVHLQLSRLERPPVFVAIVQDTSERKEAAEAIERMYYYDAVTELPNRFLFKDRLSQALAHVGRTHQVPVVFCVDIDRFKAIIETLGHEVGDKVLKAIGGRLKDVLRDGDTVARMGGDEFMLVLPGTGTSSDVAKVAQRTLATLSRPFNVDGHELHLTASIGISVYPSDGEDADTLIKNADTAMYRAKEQGKNNYQLFSPKMNAKAFGKLALESSLRRALERGELVLHYQPVYSFASGLIVGNEALLRWQHPEMGLVFPTDFVPIAEEIGLITALGEWVLKTACVQNKLWCGMGFKGLGVAVNISPHQIRRKDFVELLSQILKESGMPPEQLTLELTESIFMDNTGLAMDTLSRLKHMNIELSIDDFGTGYCSLGYLKNFEMDTIKIDQSFTRHMTEDPDYFAIVSSVISLAHSLRLKVVAEGVETEAQFEQLKNCGCDYAQGFLISKPLAADELTSFLIDKLPRTLKKIA